MYKIKNDFDGANIKVISSDNKYARLEVELRDTAEDWFYWCFKVEGAEGMTVTFEFEKQNRVGYYGAAVSQDMKNWIWQHPYDDTNGKSFTYTFGADEHEVYFAHDFCYRPEQFFEFAKKSSLTLKPLCKSKKGRDIPYYDSENGDEIILLTARHHACESTGSYVLEGVLENILSSPEFSKYRIICVPFVDLDGVIDGDQGKARTPYDHNRDYNPNVPAIYSATRKIRQFPNLGKIAFAFDFHSPWHWGEENDTVFIPLKSHSRREANARFSALFEDENSDISLPHYSKDNIHPDTRWNSSKSFSFAVYFDKLGADLSFTLETPYFKASGVPFTAESARNTGKAFARAFKRYVKENKA